MVAHFPSPDTGDSTEGLITSSYLSSFLVSSCQHDQKKKYHWAIPCQKSEENGQRQKDCFYDEI